MILRDKKCSLEQLVTEIGKIYIFFEKKFILLNILKIIFSYINGLGR